MRCQLAATGHYNSHQASRISIMKNTSSSQHVTDQKTFVSRFYVGDILLVSWPITVVGGEGGGSVTVTGSLDCHREDKEQRA